MKLSSKVILGALFLMGAFLRVYQIGFHCLWTEEIYTLSMAKMPLLQILFNQDFTSPLFYILAHISYLIFGSGISIRYPSVVFGILLIPAAYWLGVTYRNEIVGLYMAMLTTISIPLVYYSQYARSYELSILSFVILLVLYIKLKRGEGNEPLFWILALINLYVHLFSLIPIAILCADIIAERLQRAFYALLVFFTSLPLINTIYQVIIQRSVSAGVSYGASPLQMVFLSPMEFFNTNFLNIFFLFGIGVYLDKDPLKIRLVVVTIITAIFGVVCASFTPTLPRYIMTISMIILLIASVAIVELTNLCKLQRYEIIIFIIITFIFVWMVFPNIMSHYSVEQYAC